MSINDLSTLKACECEVHESMHNAPTPLLITDTDAGVSSCSCELTRRLARRENTGICSVRGHEAASLHGITGFQAEGIIDHVRQGYVCLSLTAPSSSRLSSSTDGQWFEAAPTLVHFIPRMLSNRTTPAALKFILGHCMLLGPERRAESAR
mmetsp:Transcript_11069/g.34190  ORF Transcript_11069/g.34190 Transcript_11069/m.34190 type:complete len:151 (-) Transcript_11069:195-647(-)